ncbi:MAG: hypothetical protein JEZ11_24625 [Desulfobacterales bacterium]|nr:hypothetical protein [Desulfobacterales bacterium]
MSDKIPEAVEAEDFMKSLDALELLASGVAPVVASAETVVLAETEDLEKSVVVDEELPAGDELEKSFPDKDEDDDDGDVDEDAEKSFAQAAADESENIEKAIEVSDFLTDLVDQISSAIDGIKKSIGARMDAMEKSIAAQTGFNAELAKSLKTGFTVMDGGIKGNVSGLEDLRKSVEVMADGPARGRKAVVSTLEKSFATDSLDPNKGNPWMDKKSILSAMDSALEKGLGNISVRDVVRYEATGELQPHVAKALGINQ